MELSQRVGGNSQGPACARISLRPVNPPRSCYSCVVLRMHQSGRGAGRGRVTGAMPAIFISHSSLDGKIADDIKATLARLGFDRVFLDFDKETGIGAGENWEKRLYEELSRCHAVILAITPNWMASKWCFAELQQARALGKLIFPIVCAPIGDRK